MTFKATKIENDKKNVKVIWLVVVKLYGTMPIKLFDRMNKKVVAMKGKYFSLPVARISDKVSITMLYNRSINLCQPLGITKKEFVVGSLIKNTMVCSKNNVTRIANVKFVKERSKPATCKLIRGAILN